MIVYRSWSRSVDVREALRRLPGGGDERLIAWGELEAGIADALFPERDDIPPPLAPGAPLPATVQVGVPEGYAFYALYPQAYRIAARRFQRELRPERVTVIGIRGIGAGLSMAVAEELTAPVWRCTVRPRGHPFDRRLALTGRLERELRARAGWWFAIVDEGPGISGSSFAATAAKLNELGAPDERIVFFPSWLTDGSGLSSAAARARWPRHRQYVTPFEETAAGRRFAGARDLSGGCWRALLYPHTDAWPAVQPFHERRKYLIEGCWYKFAGLGRYGREKLRFLEGAIEDGFLAQPRIHGRPVSAVDEAFARAVRRHIASRARCEMRRGASWDELREMVEVNAREGLGAEPGRGLGYLDAYRAAFEDAPAHAVDNRLMAHEWLETASGFVKTDGADHHADHFFPGPQNVAWDAAGAAIELGIDVEGTALPFYRTAYAAFRLGYAAMAVQALGASPDGRRFAALELRYASQLRALIASKGQTWHE